MVSHHSGSANFVLTNDASLYSSTYWCIVKPGMYTKDYTSCTLCSVFINYHSNEAKPAQRESPGRSFLSFIYLLLSSLTRTRMTTASKACRKVRLESLIPYYTVYLPAHILRHSGLNFMPSFPRRNNPTPCPCSLLHFLFRAVS